MRTLLIIVAACLAPTMLGSAAQAGDSVDSSVQSGRSALGSRWSYPWYDESTDGVRVIELEAEEKTSADSDPSDSSSSSLPAGTTDVLVVVVGATILGGLAWLLARAYLKAEDAGVVGETRSSREIDITRIEHLPFRVEAGKTDLLAEARRLYGEERYSEAMVYLYSHQLLQLDRLHVILLAKGKTNRQYLREAAGQAHISDPFAASMIAFEDVFFGHHELSRARFEACLAAVERLAIEHLAVEVSV